MADREYVTTDRGAGRGTSLVAWLALIVGLLAFWLAWMAYDRTGADLDQRIQQGVQQASDNVQQGAQDAEEAIDAGPDGVDQDDTDTITDPNAPTDGTTNETTQP